MDGFNGEKIKRNNMSKVLVTGVAGLLGSHFSRHLLAGGHEVIGIDNFFGGYKDFVHSEVQLHIGNLEEQEFVNIVFNKTKPEYVYHFAAYAAVGLSHYVRNFNYMNNVVASANVINACVNYEVEKLIFTSSMDVYGENEAPFTEDQVPKPNDPYGIAKYTIEQDIAAANKHFGLRYTIIRPHNVVGIYQNIWDRYRNVIGIWARKILKGEPITVFGDGSQKRAFSDIFYYMTPFSKLMYDTDKLNTNGEIFNIGADQDISILEAAQIMSRVARNKGYKGNIVHLEERKEVHTMYCDHTKAKTILGFEDKTDLEKLMKDILQWAISQPEREVKTMAYEIEKKIYSYWK